ncbi:MULTISPECIES: hypothetical protein [Photorhabdus]|uniref:hypothetical protein n=1 Tax=Photorhabdus TaxID=29487 RepID=UPI000590213F|nr:MULTISPECIES: hypothetical protein [Photorhabdus]MBS9428049.1 hypothetical protein [Photorhabdus akhurstii]MCC8458774.1 hypothetical protein [Photorhabdus aegyptia]PQQ37884.1 hypothetical protein C6H65_21595 [Photorhabdus luminescens]
MYTLTLEQLRATTNSGGVASVTLKAEGGSFIVQIDTLKGGEAVLTKARSKEPRRFGNPVQAFTLLKGLGLVVGAFNVEQWEPDQKVTHRTRPDRAEALKRAHEAVEHDKWFREQVKQGLNEADDPNTVWVSHESAKQEMQRQREVLQARIAGKVK